MRGTERFLGATILMAIFSFGATGAAELPKGLDRKAVADAFESVNLAICKKPKGPTGEGHVVVTFAPTGKATAATVDSPTFARTKVGKCIEKEYGKLKVSPFTGDSVSIGKKFKIE